MPVFDHYDDGNNLMGYNMHVDPLFSQAQSDLVTVEKSRTSIVR